MTTNGLAMAWKRLLKRSKLIDFHLHGFSHEAITRFFERGLTIPEAALISGHKDPRMLFRYTHLRPQDVSLKLAAHTSDLAAHAGERECRSDSG